MTRKSCTIRRRRVQAGATLVEFCLTFLIVMLVVFWTWEIVMIVYTYTVISEAAKEGARYAIVHGPSVGNGTCSAVGSAVTPVVQQYAKYSLHDVSAIGITVSCPNGVNPPSQVSVAVSYTYVPYLKLAGLTAPVITSSAAGRIVY